MRIFLLTALVMIAFAANSVLTRFAIAGGHIDPTGFAVVRVISGAAMLWLFLTLRGGRLQIFSRTRAFGALTLAVYIIGFSLAYLTLDAGLGALILFGVVQIAMFAHGALFGVTPTPRKMIGAAVAFAGLVLVLWPSAAVQVDPVGAVLMIAAGLGWAAYTIIGKGSDDPLANTAGNFLICAPIVALLMLVQNTFYTPTGLIVAILCGAVTSGLGYALWYAVLPKLMQSTAAVVQLSVPVIAILAGAAILAEPLDLKVILATVLVLGGIGLAVSGRSTQAGRN
ncbi:DMT family transporter [Sulfitobacter sp.]|jgi:drug/metabolite transporter (DMT)-like permease|uniref:DMT family transporter n=1 Tax=Sulfitobacter sp. TaxID=1903071 RepID=UPI0039E5B649